ncbi:uncharacterized protein [Nicotiana sylvestris]|uniref:uncharacterized protein n=1 Tax=Nicotiana sylvestris TaxID=4096 RepID=UPI00388CB97F
MRTQRVKMDMNKHLWQLESPIRNLRTSESESKNAKLKNQVHELDTTIRELRSENLKLKLGTGKKKVDHTQLTLEENLGKMKDELYKRDEQIRVLKEDLNKVKHELDRTCKWNRSSDALSWLHEHHSSNKRGLGYGIPAPKWDPKSKYLTLPENKICTYCGKIGHYKSECIAKEKASQKNKEFVQGKNRLAVKGSNQIWYMDSGCSKHMTGSKNQFLSLEDLKGCNISFENGKKDKIIGVGKVDKTDSHSIENVYLIDGLKYSLTSISQLCDRENELTCLNVLDNDPLLWHKRLGHASLSQLNKLVSKDLVIGLPNTKFKEDKVCEACDRGKQRQEQDNEEIRLIRNSNGETTVQPEDAS